MKVTVKLKDLCAGHSFTRKNRSYIFAYSDEEDGVIYCHILDKDGQPYDVTCFSPDCLVLIDTTSCCTFNPDDYEL